MDITLEDAAGQKLWFPVNPSEINIRRDRSLETFQIINLGEVDFPYGEKIKEISFSSFFPAESDPSYCRYETIPDPQQTMNLINTWMSDRQPLRLMITPTEVNVLVIISSHNSSFRANEPGDVYFDLTFRTWREYRIRTIEELSGGGTATEARPDLKPVPKTYTVQSGDSLWAIAKLNLGSGSRWRDIYEMNTSVIGPNPDRILSGQELVMPS
ncbi:LysM peptidoglycan-binding domain-containing protein [Paenibacillus ginsengarvi]|uniref:LysM peptidoglycan-binding domain-containing protein n=1 Tax=Paenibacillus ginsengarvi TaxID=400777 RepID=A0A3B0CKV9_9BACL|nr:LysM peptidoglycan-binding domain-containing protein [Paenibacillus ginsengarvi]RKN86033.1 LysM peptidoglycan-binding domain-containing protein [Paenibacillus ginsengarvi]